MSDMTQGQGGFPGQLGLTADTSPVNQMSALVHSILGWTRTVMPVQVTAVRESGNVDVQPLVNLMDGVGNSRASAPCLDIPVLRLQAGTAAIVLLPAVGDVGLMIVCDRDISSVKANRAQANPGSKRRFDPSDGVYIGGILGPEPTVSITVSDEGISLANGEDSVLSITDDGIAVTGDLTVDGDISATGEVTANAGGPLFVGLSTHTHPGNGAPPTPGT